MKIEGQILDEIIPYDSDYKIVKLVGKTGGGKNNFIASTYWY